MYISKNIILELIIVLYGALLITPYTNAYCKELTLLVGLAWMFFLICFEWRTKRDYRYFAVVTFFFFWEVLLKLLGFSTVIWSYYGVKFLVLVVICMFDYLASYGNGKIVAIGLWSVFLYNLIDNIYLYTKYRSMQLNDYRNTEFYESMFGRINAGSTDFCYSVFLGGLVALIYVMECKKRLLRLFMAVIYLLSVYFVVVCMGRGIAVILMVFGSCAIIGKKIYTSIDSTSKRFILLFLLGGIVFVYFFKVQILDFVIPIVENYVSQRLASKLVNIRTLLAGASSVLNPQAGDSLTGRAYMIIMDIRFWLENVKTIFIGNGFHKTSEVVKTVYEMAELNKASGHNYVFDILAQYGLVGVTYLFLFFKGLYEKGKKYTGIGFEWILFVGIMIFLLGFACAMELSVVTMLLLIVPTMLIKLDGGMYENK